MFYVYDMVNVNADIQHAKPRYLAVRVGSPKKKLSIAASLAKRTSCNAYVCDGQRNVKFSQLETLQ